MFDKIDTLSLVAGDLRCNARCPFCIAGMTPTLHMEKRPEKIEFGNFDAALDICRAARTQTALITGKGEPTLAPEHVTDYLLMLDRAGVLPIRELQTNGLRLIQDRWRDRYAGYLDTWHKLGLKVIALSLVHYEEEKNRVVYTGKQPHYDLAHMADYLHNRGFTLRLSLVMARGFLDTPEELDALIALGRRLSIEQLTVRPVAKPDQAAESNIERWVADNGLTPEELSCLAAHLEHRKSRTLRTLAHGAVVYDVDGQNVCLTNCLTHNHESDVLRQLIYFPDGSLRYLWDSEAAVIFGPLRRHDSRPAAAGVHWPAPSTAPAVRTRIPGDGK